MKYGIVLYKETTNIGDDIQVYAAAQFLPKIDVIIDREHLDEEICDEPVCTIMNGWFLHRKWNWPPANYLRPFFVAFHYADYTKSYFYGKHIKDRFLDGPGLEYLRAWGPIGCRDVNTEKLLKSKGIEAFFSGCMTLTLPQMKKNESQDKYVCFVDLNPKVSAKLIDKAKNEGVKTKIISHLIPSYGDEITWDERARKVEELLTTYQNASCVVTSRLHCALPCLALGTPVLLIRKDLDNIRFQPYVDWMHTASEQDAFDLNINYSFSKPPKNSGAHIETRNKLIRMVEEFVQSAEILDEKYHLDEVDRLLWHDRALRECLEDNLRNYKDDIVDYEKILHKLECVKQKNTVAKQFGDETSILKKLYLNLKIFGVKKTFEKILKKVRKWIV